jgi:pimeloyl-ACP methyl ester carboxylesterase
MRSAWSCHFRCEVDTVRLTRSGEWTAQRLLGASWREFDQDAIDNRASLARGRLQMPVLAIGGDHSFAATMAFVMRFTADDVHQVVIANSGHWLMEEQPQPTIAAIRAFLDTAPHAESCARPPR